MLTTPRVFRPIFVSIFLVFLSQTAMATDAPGSGQFTFDSWNGPDLPVYYHEPSGDSFEDAPIVIVLHGTRRNAEDYAESWRELSREFGLRVYAPEFSRQDFRGSRHYNLGSVGSDRPSAFSALEPLFAAIRARGETSDGYYLFGHSAGAQFVHRALFFEDLDNLELAIAANAGWYTLPDKTTDWPYGTGTLPVGGPALKAWLEKPLLIMLGDQDTDPNGTSLRKTTEAMEQGPHRFARGQYFFQLAKQAAEALNAEFRWRKETVPGVAHSNRGMAKAAAPIIAAHARRKRNETQ